MSDLVEKVTRAILGFDHLTDQQWAPHWKAIQRSGITPPKAKRAIAAVAEWLDEHHQIDKDGSVHCALTRQYTQKESK